MSIVAGGLVTGPSGARVAFPMTYVPPPPGTSDDADTVIRGAETLSWSILTQVSQTAPPDGRILFEGCYYVPEGLRPGQVPFLYLFSLAIRRDFIRPNPEIDYARYNGQYLLPPARLQNGPLSCSRQFGISGIDFGRACLVRLRITWTISRRRCR